MLKTKLEYVKSLVEALSKDELKQFAEWFAELQAERWDLQIEVDVAAGRLDKLAEEALSEFKAGRTRPL